MKDKKFDILVVGELNVDLILNNIQTFPKIGTEIIADQMTITLGSSSAIFASNVSVLGAKVAFVGEVGDDNFGKLVLNSLQQKNVDTDYIKISQVAKTGASIILNYQEDRAIVTHPGAMEDLICADVSEEMLKSAKHLHVSSVFLQPGIKKCLTNLFKRAKDFGITTSLDIQWDPQEKWDIDIEKLLPLVDVFLPNKQEILAITKEDNIEKAIDKLSQYANIIALKMGNKGSIGFQNNKKFKVPPFLNKDVVDAIGAGDSFNAGFIFMFINNKRLQDCLQFGNLTGAINTTAAGGTTAFYSFEEVKKTAKEQFNFLIN
jgi:sugar/nucleoside kinase (ribokinase family)